MPTISVIGLGKLGAPLLATVVSRGFEVIGVDIDWQVVEKIKRVKAPVEEPQLTQLLIKYKSKIGATTNFEEATLESDISFIIVPTPSTRSGAFSNKYVISAATSIGRALRKKDSYHLAVVTSTVLPGSIDKEVIPVLERSSGKNINTDFGVCYNPEFVALGSVIDNLLRPDLVLIGQSDQKAGQTLEKFYKKFCLNNPPVFRMSPINAEIAKIALNSYITTKISFANTLAEICEKIPGGNVDEVARAIGADSRIGTKYLRGALAYGGPCFPRDNRAFAYFAEKYHVRTPIAVAADTVNENITKKLALEIIRKVKKQKGKVSVLGLAYKTDTDVAEESAGVKLANILAAKSIDVSAWDPKAVENAKNFLSKKVTVAETLKDCLSKAHVIVITTPWKGFKNLPIPAPGNPHKPILIDCWRILDPLKYQKVATYKTVGIGDLSL